MMQTLIKALDVLYERLQKGFTRRQKVCAGLVGVVILPNYMFRAACPPERRFFKKSRQLRRHHLRQHSSNRQFSGFSCAGLATTGPERPAKPALRIRNSVKKLAAAARGDL